MTVADFDPTLIDYRDYVRRETRAKSIRRQVSLLIGLCLVLMGFIPGMIFGGYAHKDDYAQGKTLGEQQIMSMWIAKNQKDMNALKHNPTANLCVYADLACGYYHNPNPPHHRRP